MNPSNEFFKLDGWLCFVFLFSIMATSVFCKFPEECCFLSIRAITAVYFLHCINTWSVWERATELALAEANCHGSWVRAILSITRQELCSRDDALKTVPLSLLVWCSNFIEGILLWIHCCEFEQSWQSGTCKILHELITRGKNGYKSSDSPDGLGNVEENDD